MHNSLRPNRRVFLKQLAASAFVVPFITRGLMAASPNGKVNHASFGAGGMAWADLTAIAGHPAVHIAAVAEPDAGRAADFKTKFPDAKVYTDWRELLDKEKNLDSVNVSTPDHMHGPIGMSAMQRGLHVYGQKPLTHDMGLRPHRGRRGRPLPPGRNAHRDSTGRFGSASGKEE